MSDPDQAFVDPAKLHELAGHLTKLAHRIRELDQDLEHQLARLGETFRDSEYDKFKSHFRSSRRKLTEFVEEITGVVPKLHRDADHIVASQRVAMDP